jgi:uncharacterized protein GlcG (DUF336 family)
MSRRRAIVTLALAIGCALEGCSSPPPKNTGGAQAVSTEAVRAAREAAARAACHDLPSARDLQEYLRRAPAEGGEAGGMFGGKMEWAAIVNRNGEICAAAVATEDPAAAWPAGQAIAKAKAYTANAFSTDTQPLSTARLYTLTQPGHSWWGLAGLNPFNADCVVTPREAARTDGRLCGGAIAVGGGVPLYKARIRIGGLGVSGDTACTDHEIAKRVRHVAQLDPERGPLADDISYAVVDGPSVFTHPLCPNTWLNGRKIGDEPKAIGR